jgi:tRNA (Thr-GGU) A37 N-methylase
VYRPNKLVIDTKVKIKQLSGDSLTMDYFDNLDNGPLKKYKKIIKMKKIYKCILLLLD